MCEDFIASSSLTLSFAPCEMKACYNLTLEDNKIAEKLKLYPIFLERTVDLHESIRVDPFIGELIIFDDDGTLTPCTTLSNIMFHTTHISIITKTMTLACFPCRVFIMQI